MISLDRHSSELSSMRTDIINTTETIEISGELYAQKGKVLLDIVGVVCSKQHGYHMASHVKK